jgi:hypothetical protein
MRLKRVVSPTPIWQAGGLSHHLFGCGEKNPTSDSGGELRACGEGDAHRSE